MNDNQTPDDQDPITPAMDVRYNLALAAIDGTCITNLVEDLAYGDASDELVTMARDIWRIVSDAVDAVADRIQAAGLAIPYLDYRQRELPAAPPMTEEQKAMLDSLSGPPAPAGYLPQAYGLPGIPPDTPPEIRAWLDENDFSLADHGDGLYKLMCNKCGTIRGMRDVTMADIERYKANQPDVTCPGLT